MKAILAVILIFLFMAVVVDAQKTVPTRTRTVQQVKSANTNLMLVIGNGSANSVYAEVDTAKGLAAFTACMSRIHTSILCESDRSTAQTTDANTRVLAVMGAFWTGLKPGQTPDSLFADNKLIIVSK